MYFMRGEETHLLVAGFQFRLVIVGVRSSGADPGTGDCPSIIKAPRHKLALIYPLTQNLILIKLIYNRSFLIISYLAF